MLFFIGVIAWKPPSKDGDDDGNIVKDTDDDCDG